MMTQNPSVVFTDLLASQTPGVLWPALPAARHSAVLALLFQMESSQWLSAAALRERQFAQLRSLLAHARRYCRYYEERLPEDAARKWSSVSLLTRHDVQSHAESLLAQTIPAVHGKTFDITTGGSTGEPVTVRRSQLTQLFWEAATLRDHLWHRRNLSGTMAIIRHFDRPVETSRPGRWGNGIFHSGPAWHLPVSTEIDRQLPWLQSVNPDVLLTYPPNLSALMVRMTQQKIGLPRLREVRTISGTVSEDLRQRCQAILGLPLIDLYSAQEVGVIGIQCPESGLLHIQSENLLVEVLDAQGQPCKEAETGQVVVTDLHNFAMPLIRYALRDWAEVGPACPCGRGLPTLRAVKGRNRNMAYSPDGKPYWPVLGLNRFRQIIPSLRQYQLVQTERDAITVKLVCDRFPSGEQLQSLHDTLTEALGYTYRLEWQMHSTELPLSASGKFEEFMSLLPESGQIDEAR
jgi:phenylacetate-CoA ligase